jgi:hypothetical protein
MAEYNRVELDFVNAFTKILEPLPNGSGASASARRHPDDYSR